MANPFDTVNDILNNEILSITIWVEVNGRKKNTFISGWFNSNSNMNEIKEHIKNMKKKFACNGSFKIENDDIIIQLQGEHHNNIYKYLINNGISSDFIKIRG